MRNVFEKILELESIPCFNKHQQIVNGVLNAIEEKILANGDMLPSVNAMIREVGFSRETIVKAYRELINKNIIESKNRVGYYVINVYTQKTEKVALMVYCLDVFQEQLFQNLRSNLDDSVMLDIFFHYGNIDVFENMLLNILGKYGMYIISPIPHPKTQKLCNLIPRNRFLMIDRFEPLEGEFNYASQEFAKSSYNTFVALWPALKKFDEFVFVCTNRSLIPFEIFLSFKKFVKEYNVKSRIIEKYTPGMLKRQTAYYVPNDSDVWNIVKECKSRKLEIGKDIGILSQNDHTIKDIIDSGGLTTFSTDFAKMGVLAAEFIKTKKPIQVLVPTVLQRRKSL